MAWQMSGPWLTIITVTKDDLAGLAQTLASAAALRTAGAVHLVVDGGADAAGTRRVVAQSAGNIAVLARPPRGIADAFNTGLAQAQGEWVWFLNSGDRVDARLTPVFLMALLENTRAEVVIGGLTYEGETGPRPNPPGELQWPPFRPWIPHPATLVRRRLFEQAGLYDERYTIGMDYEWWLRVFSVPVAADVLSAPFAVFAPGGISQQPGLRQTIARERDDAIRRHQKYLWRAWFSSASRLLRAWCSAGFARRISAAAAPTRATGRPASALPETKTDAR